MKTSKMKTKWKQNGNKNESNKIKMWKNWNKINKKNKKQKVKLKKEIIHQFSATVVLWFFTHFPICENM